MRILVIGAGAVGAALGARLLQAGEDVTFVARGEHGRMLRERGLVIHGPAGDELVRLPHVLTATEAKGPFDLIVVAVKWTALDDACQELQRLIAPSGVVAPMLNGLDSEDVVASYVGAQRTIASVAYMSSALIGPGELTLHGSTRVGFAPYRPGQEATIDDVAKRFEKAGVPVRRAPDAKTMLWEKMVWNAPFNALCALTRTDAGTALTRMEPLVKSAMLEVLAVARADGAQLPDSMADLMMHMTRTDYPRTEPSMLQDVRAGRPTEVEILQGAVVARGAQHGVPTPVMGTLAALMRGIG